MAFLYAVFRIALVITTIACEMEPPSDPNLENLCEAAEIGSFLSAGAGKLALKGLPRLKGALEAANIAHGANSGLNTLEDFRRLSCKYSDSVVDKLSREVPLNQTELDWVKLYGSACGKGLRDRLVSVKDDVLKLDRTLGRKVVAGVINDAVTVLGLSDISITSPSYLVDKIQYELPGYVCWNPPTNKTQCVLTSRGCAALTPLLFSVCKENFPSSQCISSDGTETASDSTWYDVWVIKPKAWQDNMIRSELYYPGKSVGDGKGYDVCSGSSTWMPRSCSMHPESRKDWTIVVNATSVQFFNATWAWEFDHWNVVLLASVSPALRATFYTNALKDPKAMMSYLEMDECPTSSGGSSIGASKMLILSIIALGIYIQPRS